ncbi:hypothetical protein F5I97DRAFT_1848314 [Phlebopus sp. FC_14]|nr:hypothetical protein F5I97DRAFT_1848314 [Phlebopus sp. FC_14]
MAASGSSNSLGLKFDTLQIKESDAAPTSSASNGDEVATQTSAVEQAEQPTPVSPVKEAKGEKKKPYVNPERVKSGGVQREKLTEEELAERMQRMKEQNEKIKQRKLDVKADEDAFKKTQEAERVKQAHARKVQEGVDRTREQNARRKMEKIQSREWDSGKPTGDWKQPSKPGPRDEGEGASPTSSTQQRGGRHRGGGRGGSLRRGRGRGPPPGHALTTDAIPVESPTQAEDLAEAAS